MESRVDLPQQLGRDGRPGMVLLVHADHRPHAFGDDPYGKAKPQDQGEEGRFRCFTREQIAARNDNLDISWLRDEEADAEERLTEPEDIAAAIMQHLRVALEEIEALTEELEPEEETFAEVREAAE